MDIFDHTSIGGISIDSVTIIIRALVYVLYFTVCFLWMVYSPKLMYQYLQTYTLITEILNVYTSWSRILKRGPPKHADIAIRGDPCLVMVILATKSENKAIVITVHYS